MEKRNGKKKDELPRRFELRLRDLESRVLPLHHRSFRDYLVPSITFKRFYSANLTLVYTSILSFLHGQKFSSLF